MRYGALVPRVDLSTPTYRRLLQRAESFDDSAEDVIARLLDEVEGDEPETTTEDALDERFGARATPGSILPEREYWVPILMILAQAGGALSGSHVITALGDVMRDRLTPGDFEVLRMGEVRWRNRARFARLRMKEQGLLSDQSPRGIWEITNEGRRYLDENWADWNDKAKRLGR